MIFPSPSARTLTELDHIRISKLLQRMVGSPETVAQVDDVINSAVLISSYKVPANLVTMYSQVLIADGQTGEERK